MGGSLTKYRFPPLGLTELNVVGLNSVVEWGKAHAGKAIEFSELVRE
jgi:hypothetical protein